ncbi:uncharacterized protein BROUX77_004225 [Berkeleyomyces rouxiae]|uniref:uncharacterized protein n=1 Tax=Berkeleyomyces rouxiae TaxID=2035830 RepID=UPI003B81AC2B
MRVVPAALLVASTALAAPFRPESRDAPIEYHPEITEYEYTPAPQYGRTIPINVFFANFYPSNVRTGPGDVLAFHFMEGYNGVAESNYDSPCTPNGGFSSAAIEVTHGYYESRDVFFVPISNGHPKWFYNFGNNACNEHAAVGSINSPETYDINYQNFMLKAQKMKQTQTPEYINAGVYGPNPRFRKAVPALPAPPTPLALPAPPAPLALPAPPAPLALPAPPALLALPAPEPHDSDSDVPDSPLDAPGPASEAPDSKPEAPNPAPNRGRPPPPHARKGSWKGKVGKIWAAIRKGHQN